MSGILGFIRKVCVQTAVYWKAPKSDGFGGMEYEYPVEIKCRWDEKMELIRTDDGREIVSKAQVLSPEDLEEQGVLYLGYIQDLYAEQRHDPKKVEKAFEIQAVRKTPLFRSTDKFVKIIYL